MKRFSLITATLASLASVAITPLFADTNDLETQVDSLLATFHAEYDFPGATVAFVLADGTSGDAAIGLADAEVGIAMTTQSRMLAASIGKTLVGALALSLEDEGLLHRADPVSLYLGDAAWFARLPNAAEMTVGQLLTHTSGLPDHVHMDGAVSELISLGNGGTFRPEDAIAFLLDTDPLFEAGTAWSYSDTGYLLLGLVIETATGRDAYDLIDERFLSPLALDHTSPSTSPKLAGLAVGYTVPDNPFDLPARTANSDGALLWNPAIEWTGGGFVSTAHDLATWGHALFNGDAMEASYLDRLLEGAPVHPDAPDIFYGSGVGIYAQTPLGPVYGHGGWVPGYVSSLRHYADANITVAFQINTDVGVVDDSTDLVSTLELALARLLIEAANTH